MSDNKSNKSSQSDTSGQQSDKRYTDTLRQTKDHRAAVRAGYGWNKWATENAKGTGNW